MGPGGSTTGRVLVVCTGNVCRSPFVERLLRLHLAGSPVEVTSAGTGAPVGEPMDPLAAELLTALGADSLGHRARQLTPALVAGADLVLTATRRHRGQVVAVSPRALPCTFAFRDFAFLVRGIGTDAPAGLQEGADGLRELVRVAAARRGLVPPRPAEEVDIVDPYRRGRPVFEQMADEVMAALPHVARALSG